MNKRTMLEKQIADKKAQLAALNETTEPKTLGVAYLIESELEKSELVLAARAITGTLQDMAEKVAKLEASEVMPILDSLKASFGPEIAEGFNAAATQNLRSLVEALKAAKDAIGNEVTRMENAIAGLPTNDIAMDAPAPEMEADPLAAPMDGEADLGADMDAELPDDDGMEGEDMAGEAGLGMPDDMNAAGRDRKESFVSDKAILEAFVTSYRSTKSGSESARLVAEQFSIDEDDVREIVRDNRKA